MIVLILGISNELAIAFYGTTELVYEVLCEGTSLVICCIHIWRGHGADTEAAFELRR